MANPQNASGLEGRRGVYTVSWEELGRISRLPRPPALREAAGFLVGLVHDQDFLGAWVFPHLERAERAESWYVARRHDAPDGSYSLQVFIWPPGTRTLIHDHSSWGVLCSAVGSVLEERYERIDDGLRPEYARLEMAWRRVWDREDGASTVLPYAGGIHRVGNPGSGVAASVHLYGPRVGHVDGRDYDPSRDYVCDRRDPGDPQPDY